MLSRRKYIDEVLNEDRRIYHQVFDREKEQARVFNEVVSPKGERDISTEVKVDSEIDRLKGLLDNKIVIGEGIIAPRVGKDPKGKDLERFNLSVADITRTYNDIVRNAIRPDVRSSTRDMVKTKLQELNSLINTLVYLVPEVMLDVIRNPPVAGGMNADFNKMRAVIPVLGSLLNQYGVYATISKQLSRNSFKPIDNYDIQASINNFINSRPITGPSYPIGTSEEDLERKLAYLLRAYVAGMSGVRYVDSDKMAEERRRLLEEELDRPLSKSEIDKIRLGFRGSAGASTGSPTAGGPAGTAVIPTTPAASVPAVPAPSSAAAAAAAGPLGEETPELPLINNFETKFNVPVDELREMNIGEEINQTKTDMDTATNKFLKFYSDKNKKIKPPAADLDRVKDSVMMYKDLANESDFIKMRDKNNIIRFANSISETIDKIKNYKFTAAGVQDIILKDNIKTLCKTYISFYKNIFDKYIAPIKMQQAAEEDTEGAGRPKNGRFSYKLGKILDYDDERNEMYDY